MARKTIWILAILACLSTSLFAQITGDIFVTVTDRSGAVIPNATITLKNLETGAVRTATTAGDGSVRFTLLNTGRYEVQAEAGGFGGAKSQTTVSSGQVQELKFGLEVATTRQEVVVTDSAVQINTVNAQLATTTTTKEVANLPLNTSTAGILGLAQTAPGVSPFPPQDNNGFQGFGNFNVNGGRGRRSR